MPSIHKTKINIEGCEVDQTYHDPSYPFDTKRVREVKVVAFAKDGKILAVKKGRNIDLPSGWPEWDDDKMQDTAKREVYEQASVYLGKVVLAAVIEETFDGMEEPPTYSLVVSGKIKAIEDLPAQREHKRAFVTKQNFLKRYSIGNAKDMEVLLGIAELKSFGRVEPVEKKRGRRGRPPLSSLMKQGLK